MPPGAAFLAAFAVVDGYVWEQYEVAAWPMIAVGLAAMVVARHRPDDAVAWPYRFLWMPAIILFLDGITYLMPDPCGPLRAMAVPISFVQYVYLNIMGATRMAPLMLSTAGGFGLLFWPPGRRAGAWALGCALLVWLVDAQLHYLSDPGHCSIGE